MLAASVNSGFIQETPKLRNQFVTDKSLQRTLRYFLTPEVLRAETSNLEIFGDYVVSEEIFSFVADAERNQPFVDQFDAFGHVKNSLVTSNGWRRLKDISAREGILETAYARKYEEQSRVVQFAKYYLFSPSSAIFTCPLAMTDGCARVLELYLPKHEAFRHLTSRDPDQFWTSGQWMTERSGGSDVSGTETIATKIANSSQYMIDGFKWFSSATDSQVTLLLAKEGENQAVSCYIGYVKYGGARIVRLKSKLGTKALPTAELELKGLLADRIGQREKGISIISTVLTITRIHNSVNAVAFFRRSLEIAKEFSKVRKVFNTPLCHLQAHVGVLAELEVQQRGMLFLAFYCVSLLGKIECRTATDDETVLLRLLSSIVKAVTAKVCLAGISECMEALGGVGYLENEPELNIARLERDAQVLTIWEGTTNVLSDDFVRAVKAKPKALKALTAFFDNILQDSPMHILKRKVDSLYTTWKQYIISTSLGELRSKGRVVGFFIARLVASALLISDAGRDENAVAVELARRFVMTTERPAKFDQLKNSSSDFQADYEIVFGSRLEPDKSKL
ncbi:acyl-CoA dehydrogenase/oxidase C-terminal [Lipomyces arxii]|uniref:acyl-CoA dehydrogenase/oxidase C-terminal n=1 Tax=Lipomyces arxii TaxID=56418 RepID=UPI0034CE98C0